MIARGQIFLTVLGAEASQLHPEVLAQMRAVDASDAEAHGLFTTAGSRFGMLSMLVRPFVGPAILLTRFGRDVPFVLTDRPLRGVDGIEMRDSARELVFPGSTQSLVDRMIETSEPGVVRTLLGVRQRVEVMMRCSVTDYGALRMRSGRVALLIGRVRIPLSGIFGVDVTLEDGWDDDRRRRTISMRAHNPLFGTVLEYRGWYRYADRRGGAPQYV
jgi:hypothetical protein